MFGLALSALAAPPAEPVVTILADFEDQSVAAAITDYRNVVLADCAVRPVSIPARGKGALAVEIGATVRDVSVACDLTFRETTRFPQADRVSAFCWLNEGEMELAFRVRDARGQLFETAAQPATAQRRWVLISADLAPERLHHVQGEESPAYPLEIEGFRLTTQRIGKQTIYLDELQVEHRVEPRELMHGQFRFKDAAGAAEATRIYEPGAAVPVAVVLENRSRTRALEMSVDLAWIRPDGSVLQTQSGKLPLPASGNDFRSYQAIDFTQTLREPGLYRLVARARAPGWSSPNTFETSIAVTPSNRRLSRGRSTLFAVQTNFLREPELDQMLEIGVARDLGVNLLAIETSWRRLEPKPGVFNWGLLDTVVTATTQRDMAVLLVLGEPPEWLNGKSNEPVEALAKLIAAVAEHFGPRVQRFSLSADLLRGADLTARLTAVEQIRERLGARGASVLVLPPPIPVDQPALATEVAAYLKQHPAAPLLFLTEGEVAVSLKALDTFRRQGGFEWQASHWWQHRNRPTWGAGPRTDAESVLRQYVQAAAAGVGGLLLFDLRDDDNERGQPDALRGLVRRDFSPKATVLGYATAAAELTGFRYAGPLAQAPDCFESALFIGGERQVAMLFPRPNRVLPAAVTVTTAGPGELSLRDFERRPLPLLKSAAPTLALAIPRPMFVTLVLKAPESEPKLGIAPAWLRVPQTVFCGADSEFDVVVQAPLALHNSYIQVQTPKNCPVSASLSATALRAEARETVTQTVRLAPKQPKVDFERGDLTLRVSIEGEALEVPLVVRRLAEVRPLGRGEAVTADTCLLGELQPPSDQRASAKARLFAGYNNEALQIAVVVEDDRIVPFKPDAAGPNAGDQLLIGLALEQAANDIEVRIDPSAAMPEAQPLETGQPAPEWQCTASVDEKSHTHTFVITVPGKIFGAKGPAAGQQLRLAARYVDDDADGFPPSALMWGGGLDGSRVTDDFRWLKLGAGR